MMETSKYSLNILVKKTSILVYVNGIGNPLCYDLLAIPKYIIYQTFKFSFKFIGHKNESYHKI